LRQRVWRLSRRGRMYSAQGGLEVIAPCQGDRLTWVSLIGGAKRYEAKEIVHDVTLSQEFQWALLPASAGNDVDSRGALTNAAWGPVSNRATCGNLCVGRTRQRLPSLPPADGGGKEESAESLAGMPRPRRLILRYALRDLIEARGLPGS